MIGYACIIKSWVTKLVENNHRQISNVTGGRDVSLNFKAVELDELTGLPLAFSIFRKREG